MTARLLLALALLAVASCATAPYDCRYWTPENATPAKQAYCFPDCDSCGPAIRGKAT